jgi:single-strand DNA-binding protein
MSFQQTVLVGNLGKDPEVKYIDQDNVVANFSLATTERWKGRDGQTVTHTEWFRMVAWRNTAKLVEAYLHKGDKVFVVCKKRERSYENNGQQRYVTEFLIDQIRLMSSSNNDEQGEQQQTQHSQPKPETQQKAAPTQGSFDEFTEGPDDLPF